MAIFDRKPSFWGPPAVRFQGCFHRPLLLKNLGFFQVFTPKNFHNSMAAMVKMSPRECRVIPLKDQCLSGSGCLS